MLTRIRRTLDANIDYGSAIMAALFLGTVVFCLNYAHGAARAVPAALKQATYTFFVAGFIVKNNERLARRLARRLASPAASLLLAATVSSCLAVGLTFLVHSARGTPEPVLSTLPTALIGPPAFLLLGWRARRATSGAAPASD